MRSAGSPPMQKNSRPASLTICRNVSCVAMRIRWPCFCNACPRTINGCTSPAQTETLSIYGWNQMVLLCRTSTANNHDDNVHRWRICVRLPIDSVFLHRVRVSLRKIREWFLQVERDNDPAIVCQAGRGYQSFADRLVSTIVFSNE